MKSPVIRPLLPLAWLYGLVVRLRGAAYDRGWLRSRAFGLPVICVGNLAVGGTGKTPHTEYLIRLLRAAGLRVATLSRGYRRHTRGFLLATTASTAAQVGDEPAQMKGKYPDVTVAVCEDRCEGIRRLMEVDKAPNADKASDVGKASDVDKASDADKVHNVDEAHNVGKAHDTGKTPDPDETHNVGMASDVGKAHNADKASDVGETPDVIVLDDAYQHRRVRPGLSILLTDYHRPFCIDALLPAGRLREPWRHGKERADLVVVTKCPPDLTADDRIALARRLALRGDQRLYFSTLLYSALRPVFPQAADPRTDRPMLQADEAVLVVTGIAQPAPLLEEVRRHTVHIATLAFADHHDFSDRDLRSIGEAFDRLLPRQAASTTSTSTTSTSPNFSAESASSPPGRHGPHPEARPARSRLILTTEKDAVRLRHHPHFPDRLKPHLYALPVEVSFLFDEQPSFNQNIIAYVSTHTRDRRLPPRADAHDT